MTKPSLTVDDLLSRGFDSVGEWLVSNSRLVCGAKMSADRGVYAFGVNDRVVYIGLASKSLAKRLYFYGNPGPSQSTNIRLNRIILEHLCSGRVSILAASPPDFSWNRMVVRGPEGLEAGLIESYDLPWNKRGAVARTPVFPEGSRQTGEGTLDERVLGLVRKRPRITEAEIARGLFGGTGYQQKVNPACRRLTQSGRIRRLGAGGASDPFIYVPI